MNCVSQAAHDRPEGTRFLAKRVPSGALCAEWMPEAGTRHDAVMAWFSVRSVIQFDDVFEERIMLFSAESADVAMSRAEAEAAEYIKALGVGAVLDFQQSYELDSERIEDGTELFSLMRTSDLDPESYLSAHFDTGAEHQR